MAPRSGSYGAPESAALVIQGVVEGVAMPAAVRLGEDYSAEAFGGWPDSRTTPIGAGGFCRWLRTGTEWIGGR